MDDQNKRRWAASREIQQWANTAARLGVDLDPGKIDQLLEKQGLRIVDAAESQGA